MKKNNKWKGVAQIESRFRIPYSGHRENSHGHCLFDTFFRHLINININIDYLLSIQLTLFNLPTRYTNNHQ